MHHRQSESLYKGTWVCPCNLLQVDRLWVLLRLLRFQGAFRFHSVFTIVCGTLPWPQLMLSFRPGEWTSSFQKQTKTNTCTVALLATWTLLALVQTWELGG